MCICISRPLVISCDYLHENYCMPFKLNYISHIRLIDPLEIKMEVEDQTNEEVDQDEDDGSFGEMAERL